MDQKAGSIPRVGAHVRLTDHFPVCQYFCGAGQTGDGPDGQALVDSGGHLAHSLIDGVDEGDHGTGLGTLATSLVLLLQKRVMQGILFV